jgi:P4 family phage/plasmid primase-like protien
MSEEIHGQEVGVRIVRQESNMADIQKWIRMSMKYHAQSWLLNPDGTVPAEAEYGPLVSRQIPMSDLTASLRMYECFNGTIHFATQSKQWYVWNGIFHEKIEGDLLVVWLTRAFVDAQRWALQQVKSWYEVAASTLTGKAAQAKMAEYSKGLFLDHRNYRDKIHNSVGMGGLATAIRGTFGVVDSHFTNDQRWLVFHNGVVDLEELRANPPMPGDLGSIKLLPHDPKRPVWRCIEADFDPAAEAPAWKHRYLERSLPDPDLRKFLAVTSGAAILGQSKIKTIPVLTGPRDSGKTVFTDTMANLFGGYGGQPDTTAINKGTGVNFEQDKLRGLRFVAVSEPNTDRKIDESFLKKFTGGDAISSRTLHAASSEWKSQGVLFFATNMDLKFNTADHAILSRLATVVFPHRFYRIAEVPPGKEDFLIDYTLEPDIQKEFSGIVNWVLNGALVFLAEGVVIPESVINYRFEQEIDSSSVMAWLETHVKTGESPYTLDPPRTERKVKSEYADVKSVYMAYSMWCAEEGEQIVTRKAFSKEIRRYLDVEFIKSGDWRIPRMSIRPNLDAWSAPKTDDDS